MSRIQISAIGVSTEPRPDANGVMRTPTVVNHPKTGVPTKDPKVFLINVTDGSRSNGVRRPYVNLYMEESMSLERGHAKVVQLWGQFAVENKLDSDIVWQAKVDPAKLYTIVHELDIHEGGLVYAMATQLTMRDYQEFSGKSYVGIRREITQDLGIEIEPLGKFITIPNELPEYANYKVAPFKVNDALVEQSTEFVFQNDLNSVQAVLRTFARNGRTITDKTNKIIISPETMESANAARKDAAVAFDRVERNKPENNGANGNGQQDNTNDVKNLESLQLENERKFNRMDELQTREEQTAGSLNPEEIKELEELMAWQKTAKFVPVPAGN